LLQLERLTSLELEALSRERTLILFPVGILEDHGPHLPIGTDFLTASELTARLARYWEEKNPGWTVVVAPGVPLGIQGNTRRIAFEIRGHVLRDWLVDACLALGHLGFQYFGAVSGTVTPRQLTAIEEASELLFQKTGRLRLLRRRTPPLHLAALSSAWVPPRSWEASPLWPDPEEHGGAEDTAIAKALFPDQVRESPGIFPNASQERPSSRWERWMRRRRRETEGFWGNPAQNDPSRATLKIQEWLDEVRIKLLAMTSGSPGYRLFRSGYGIFPPNRSFFAAWILGLASLILLGLTFSLSLPDLRDLTPN
jgi:creatinine amidohydrolase